MFYGEVKLGFVLSERFAAWPIFNVIVTEGRSKVAKITNWLFCKVIMAVHFSRVVNISENLR